MLEGMVKAIKTGVWQTIGKGNIIYKELLLSALIFLIAFLPRIYLLGAIMTADEMLWVGRSYKFISALQSHDWGGTFITSHPGVTTMWASGISMSFKYLSMGVATSLNDKENPKNRKSCSVRGLIAASGRRGL